MSSVASAGRSLATVPRCRVRCQVGEELGGGGATASAPLARRSRGGGTLQGALRGLRSVCWRPRLALLPLRSRRRLLPREGGTTKARRPAGGRDECTFGHHFTRRPVADAAGEQVAADETEKASGMRTFAREGDEFLRASAAARPRVVARAKPSCAGGAVRILTEENNGSDSRSYIASMEVRHARFALCSPPWKASCNNHVVVTRKDRLCNKHLAHEVRFSILHAHSQSWAYNR